MRTAKCKGCGAEIIWAVTEKGKLMALDAKPITMFELITTEDKCRCKTIKVFQTHWATCPASKKFKK